MYNPNKEGSNNLELLLLTFVDDSYELVQDPSALEDKIHSIEEALRLIETVEYNEFK